MPDDASILSLDTDLVAEAERLGVDVNHAAETGLADAVRAARGEEWKRENRAAIQSSNEWVEKNGLPLAKYCQF